MSTTHRIELPHGSVTVAFETTPVGIRWTSATTEGHAPDCRMYLGAEYPDLEHLVAAVRRRHDDQCNTANLLDRVQLTESAAATVAEALRAHAGTIARNHPHLALADIPVESAEIRADGLWIGVIIEGIEYGHTVPRGAWSLLPANN